ncbi:MAG: alkaline phosphatase [Thermoleophilia bacterium]
MKRLKHNLLKITLAIVIAMSIIPVATSMAEDGGDHEHNMPHAKNIIIMISDGQGYNDVAATDYYQYGRTGTQVYEKFPFKSGVSTYAWGGSYDPSLMWSNFNYAKLNPTDSAAAATALSTGVKTYNAGIGVDITAQPVTHVLERAEELGKSTGVVTTVEISHATPAGFVAHNVSRNDYQGIAQEMLLSSATDVVMGAGNPWFDDNGAPVTAPNSYKYVGGKTTWDGLVAGTVGADANGDGVNDPWTLVQSRSQFQSLMDGPTPRRVAGIAPAYTTLQQDRSGNANAAPYNVPLNANEPTLAEMTRGAINVLDNDSENGFFLMVEGGAIDWAGHANQSGRMIEEETDFNKAVEAVDRWVQKNSSWEDTLLIVTADHETGYLNGPGSNPAFKPIVNNGAGVLPGMSWYSGDHTNQLVPLYAKGDAARLFNRYADKIDPVRGPYIDNTEIANTMFDALKKTDSDDFES